MISSSHNPRIQWVRALQSRARERRQAQAFVVEGVRLAEEAFAAGWQAQLALYTPDLNERGRAILDGFTGQGAPVEAVSEQVMTAASDTQTPQGLLVVLSWQRLPLPQPLSFVFIPDAVRDPGNLGTMLRTAAAAGVGAALLPLGTVDPFAPKVLRAGMGAHFRLPVWSLDWAEIVAITGQSGITLYLAAVGEGQAYTRCDFTVPIGLIVGGEAQGAGEQARQSANRKVHIPMPGGSESLNAAVAAGVLMFEAVRQRQAEKPDESHILP